MNKKSIDSLIATDMIALARNEAISDAVLVSGDEDLRVGVQQEQEFGVRVHLVGIKPSRGRQSLFLLQEADTTHKWDRDEVSAFMRCQHHAISVPSVSVPTEAGQPEDSKGLPNGTLVQNKFPLKLVLETLRARNEIN